MYHTLCNVPQTSNISSTLAGNKIVDHSDVVGASPVGAAPITSSLLTEHLTSMDWAKTSARRDEKDLSFGIWRILYDRFEGISYINPHHWNIWQRVLKFNPKWRLNLHGSRFQRVQLKIIINSLGNGLAQNWWAYDDLANWHIRPSAQ